MRVKLGNKTIHLSLKSKYKELFNNTKETKSRYLEDESQVCWDYSAGPMDKIMGIVEVATIDLDGKSEKDVVNMIKSLGLKVRTVDRENSKGDIVGDMICTANTENTEDESKHTFYVLISMIKNCEISLDILDKFVSEATIFGATPVIIAPNNLDKITMYRADAMDIEVIDKTEIMSIQKGLLDKIEDKQSLASEIMKEVSKL